MRKGHRRVPCALRSSERHGWLLVTSTYVFREVEKNLQNRMGAWSQAEWARLRARLRLVSDELVFPWVVVFSASKDRPVLFSAAAVADVLLTLDRADFGSVMEGGFYGRPVMKPGDFLRQERDSGRLQPLAPSGE